MVVDFVCFVGIGLIVDH